MQTVDCNSKIKHLWETFNFLNDDVNGSFIIKCITTIQIGAKEVYRQALTQNYGINVQGGDDYWYVQPPL